MGISRYIITVMIVIFDIMKSSYRRMTRNVR